jgi:hypothetical protein
MKVTPGVKWGQPELQGLYVAMQEDAYILLPSFGSQTGCVATLRCTPTARHDWVWTHLQLQQRSFLSSFLIFVSFPADCWTLLTFFFANTLPRISLRREEEHSLVTNARPGGPNRKGVKEETKKGANKTC